MKPHDYHRAASPVMSHDGATAGNDAAVTRSDYGRRRPIHPRRQTILVEKASTAASLATSRVWVWPRRFGRARTRAELLRLLMLPDFDRADRIGEFWSYPESRNFAELVIDCGEDRTSRPCWSTCCERPVADRMARVAEEASR